MNESTKLNIHKNVKIREKAMCKEKRSVITREGRKKKVWKREIVKK